MKHNKKQRGFTLVELVIVIAVIAILAAVLIPTFAALIKKAHLSADQQAVASMNTSLEADEVLGGAPTKLKSSGESDTEKTVFGVLEADGFTVSPVPHPLTSGYAFYWISAPVNRVVLVEMDNGSPKAIAYPANPIHGYECTCDGDNPIVKTTGGEAVSASWTPFADEGSGSGGTEPEIPEGFKNKTFLIYNMGDFTISGEGKETTIIYSNDPAYGFDTVSEITSQSGLNEGFCIKLNKDYTGSFRDMSSRSYTLDLNGHEIKADDSSTTCTVITVAKASAIVNIFDTEGKGNGRITGSNQGSLTNSAGVINITSSCSNCILNLYGGEITGGVATKGGGITVNTGGHTVNMYGGSVKGNKARNGGGIFLDSGATLNLRGGEISDNTAEGDDNQDKPGGAGIYGKINSSSSTITFNMEGGKISNNSITSSLTNYAGGGVYIEGYGSSSAAKANVTISGGEISGNHSYIGGGLYFSKCTVTISGGKISGNQASNNGGGIYVFDYSELTISSAEISSNSVESNQTNSTGNGGGIYSVKTKLIINGGTTISGNSVKITAATVTGGASDADKVGCGAGVFWCAGARDSTITFELNGGTITNNTITASQIDNQGGFGAGVACFGYGNGYTGSIVTEIKLSSSCIISDNSGANKGNQLFLFAIKSYGEELTGLTNMSAPNPPFRYGTIDYKD